FARGETYLAMAYLKRFAEGDRRVIVVNGEIIGASLRKPSDQGWICNVSSGGQSSRTDVSEAEIEAVSAISPMLKREGVLIYGIDSLVDDYGIRRVTEINTYSVGGFYTLNTVLNDPDALPKTVSALYKHLSALGTAKSILRPPEAA
ncbi:MAG: hypothetical protein AAFX02_03315, partial [Pseudomonadota bacterium]